VPVHIHDHDKHLLLDPVSTSGMLGRYLDGLDVSPPEIVEGLDDGTVVSGAGMRFTSLHTPGHTKGSVCLSLEAEGAPPLIFSGDHLFAGSIGRTDLPGGSFDELMASMAEKILPLDDEILVLPGHGPTTTIGQERRTNPFLAELRT
jgi:glyoxylase-like metal-dependent hydrolase (beta-lactamase superfamily II)